MTQEAKPKIVDVPLTHFQHGAGSMLLLFLHLKAANA
jgi:hypothetical protein